MRAEPASREVVVTVVLIFLNGETYIDEAIRSVLGQTFTQWELMLVDDGSSDRSSYIARQYAAKSPEKIRYLEHPDHENRERSASRNLGIRAGRGKYIALLDHDDVWHPEKLARQVLLLDQNPEVGMVYSATLRWFSWTGNPDDAAKDEPRPVGVSTGKIVNPPEMIPRFLRDEGQTPATCSVLMRREAVESVGAFEEEFRGLYEDQAFFYKFFLRHAAFVQAGHWDFYRQHCESCCYVASGGTWLTPLDAAYGRFLDWFHHYLETSSTSDPRVQRALAKARRPFHHPRRYRMEQTIAAGWKDIRISAWRQVRGVARRILPATVYQRLRAGRDAKSTR